MSGRAPSVDWRGNPEMEADMAEACRTMLWRDVRSHMRERWGLELTHTQVTGFRQMRGIRCEAEPTYLFGRGQEPGRRGGERGERNPAWLPVGSERLDGCGHVVVKVGDGPEGWRNWRRRSHVAWERDHGEAVPDGWVVVHADGDPANDDPSNLVAMPRVDLIVLSRLKIPYHDATTLRLAMLAAEAAMARTEARRAARGEGPCPRES